jgi:hypothetical protein
MEETHSGPQRDNTRNPDPHEKTACAFFFRPAGTLECVQTGVETEFLIPGSRCKTLSCGQLQPSALAICVRAEQHPTLHIPKPLKMTEGSNVQYVLAGTNHRDGNVHNDVRKLVTLFFLVFFSSLSTTILLRT